jgi:hypothetical protein
MVSGINLSRDYLGSPLISAFFIAFVNSISLILIAPYAPSAVAVAALLLPFKFLGVSLLSLPLVFQHYMSGELWKIILISGMWGFGTIIGSLASALTNGHFKIRKPRIMDVTRSLLGGFLMGLGASMANGCNIFHTLGGTPLLIPASIIVTIFIIIGAYFCLKLMMKFLA